MHKILLFIILKKCTHYLFDHKKNKYFSHEKVIKMETVSDFVFCFPIDSLD